MDSFPLEDVYPRGRQVTPDDPAGQPAESGQQTGAGATQIIGKLDQQSTGLQENFELMADRSGRGRIQGPQRQTGNDAGQWKLRMIE